MVAFHGRSYVRLEPPQQYSADGKWWWNGSQWVPVAQPPPAPGRPWTDRWLAQPDPPATNSCAQLLALIFTGFFGLGSLLLAGIGIWLLVAISGNPAGGLFFLGMGAILIIPTVLGIWLTWRTFTNRTGL